MAPKKQARVRQFSLGETFSRNKKKKEEAAAVAAAAPERTCTIDIYLQRPQEDLLAAVQNVRLDAMEHNVDNRKYNLMPTEGNKENKTCGMDENTAGAELGDLGERFITAMSHWPLSETSALSTEVLHEVATVCYNDPKHADSSIAERAQGILRRALRVQPPCTVKYVQDASRPGAQKIVTLQPCAEHAEPWAGQVHVLSATQTSKPEFISRSKASLRNTKSAHAETAKFGFKWLSEQVKNWDTAVRKLVANPGRDNWEEAMKLVKGHQGPLWVALYLLDVWELDLNTRLKVVQAHDGEHEQQKTCQKILKESYACRTFDQNFTYTQMQALVADSMAFLSHCPRTPVNGGDGYQTDTRQFIADARLATGRCLRLLLSLLGAAEDLGMSLTSLSFIPMSGNKCRHDVDPCLSKALDSRVSALEWSEQLRELTPRDQLRSIYYWLASKYSGMGFKPADVRRHGACLFAAVVETYGKLPSNPASYNIPGTFLDVPASTTMRALAHPCLINRFLNHCFKNDVDMLAVVASHLCDATVGCLPELMRSHRFQLVEAPVQPLSPASIPGPSQAPSPTPSPAASQAAGGSASVAPTDADMHEADDVATGAPPAAAPVMEQIPEDEVMDDGTPDPPAALAPSQSAQPVSQVAPSPAALSQAASQQSRKGSLATADVEMRAALAPIEDAACVFVNTNARHERARWLPAAQCNIGFRSELDTLLRGIVAVMLRIAKQQGVPVVAPPRDEWDTAAARALWKGLQRKPGQRSLDSAGATGGRCAPKALEHSVWSKLGGSLLMLKSALATPALQNIAEC